MSRPAFRTIEDAAEYGLEQYMEGNYATAYTYLKLAVDCGCYSYAQFLGDICFRSLDEAKHSDRETACYYLIASDAGDCDVMSCIASIDTSFIDTSIALCDRRKRFTAYITSEHARIQAMEEEE